MRGDSGRAAFDAKCRSLAAAANLPGTYAALLGTPTAPPIDALKSKTWYRPDGQLLFDGSLSMPILGFLTETKGMLFPAAFVWTGGRDSTENCADWTNGTMMGRAGDPNAIAPRWLTLTSATCSIDGYVYCFEQ